MYVHTRSEVPVARRNILADRRRLLISTVGVGLAIALILLLEGLWGGVRAGISAYPDRVGADLFVRQPGSMILTEGSVPLTAADTIRAIPGVERADPVVSQFVILDMQGTKEALDLVGYRPGAMGGPWQIAQGRTVQAADEVVLDQSLAADHGIRAGGTFETQGVSFRVVGLSSRTRSLVGGGFLFTSLDTAQRLFGIPGTATFILVRASDPAAVAPLIRARTGLAVDPPQTIAAGERDAYGAVLGQVFNLMIVIAFAAGTLIVALTVYSGIVDRLREYGIIKAMGARRLRLFRLVAGQTLVLAALGTMLGFVLYAAGSQLLVDLRPRYPSVLSLGAVVGVVVAAGGMALLAAIVPTQRVARLDPASVYRG